MFQVQLYLLLRGSFFRSSLSPIAERSSCWHFSSWDRKEPSSLRFKTKTSKYQMLQSLPFYCRTSFCELLILLLFHFSMIVGAVCSWVCLLLNICCSDISTSFKPSVLSLFSSSYGFLGIQKVKYQNEKKTLVFERKITKLETSLWILRNLLNFKNIEFQNTQNT